MRRVQSPTSNTVSYSRDLKMENIMLDSTKQFIKIVGEYTQLLPFLGSKLTGDFNRVRTVCRRFRFV